VYHKVRGQLLNGSCSVVSMGVRHHSNWTQSDQSWRLNSVTRLDSTASPIVSIVIDADYRNESVARIELPTHHIHGRLTPFGPHKQIWFEWQRFVTEEKVQFGRLSFNVKSADGMASVRGEWNPQASNSSKVILSSLIDPTKTSELAVTVGQLQSGLLFQAPNDKFEGVALLRAEHATNRWSHELRLRLPHMRQWHFKGHSKQGETLMANLTRLSIELPNSKLVRPNVQIDVQLSPLLGPAIVRPMIGSKLDLHLNLTHSPTLNYLIQMNGTHFDCDVRLSDRLRSFVSGRLLANRLDASFDWFVQPRNGAIRVIWSPFQHQSQVNVYGNHTLQINSTTIDTIGRSVLNLTSTLSVSDSSHVQLQSSMVDLNAALHPYQEVKNCSLQYENKVTRRSHQTLIQFALQRFLNVQSSGRQGNETWFELQLNGSRREGGWMHFESGCCTRLDGNLTLSKDRRDLTAILLHDQVQRRLNASMFRETDQSDQANAKEKHSLLNMFSNRFLKSTDSSSSSSSPPSSSSIMSRSSSRIMFGAKKLTPNDGPNAADLKYEVERDGQVETMIHLWAPAFKQSGGRLESEVYQGSIDFNAIQKRIQMQMINVKSGDEQIVLAAYESWLSSNFEITRRRSNQIVYSYVWHIAAERQRLLLSRSARHLEINADVMGAQGHGSTGRFLYENRDDHHRLMADLLVDQLTAGHLKSQTIWRNRLWYDLTLTFNLNHLPKLVKVDSKSYEAQVKLLLPLLEFEHATEVKLGQQFVVESDTKRKNKRVFWLRSTLHRHQIHMFGVDGDIETNDLLDLQLHLRSNNVTLHHSKVKFDGLKLIARSSHRPNGLAVFDLDLLASAIEVSHFKVNTSSHDLQAKGAWLDWHKLAHLQYHDTKRHLAQHIELISIEDSGSLRKTLKGTLYSDWSNNRFVNGSLSISNQVANLHLQLHPLLERWALGSIRLFATRTELHNQLQMIATKFNQSIESEAIARFDWTGGQPRLIEAHLNSTLESIPTIDVRTQRHASNESLTLDGSWKSKKNRYEMNGELDLNRFPIELRIEQQTDNRTNNRLVHVRHRSTSILYNSLAMVQWNDFKYGLVMEGELNVSRSSSQSKSIQFDLHVRTHTARLIWTQDSSSASGQWLPNASNPMDVYSIRVQPHQTDQLHLLNALYEIHHPHLNRPQSIDVRMLDYHQAGNVTFDLLPDTDKRLHLEYKMADEFGLWSGRWRLFDALRHDLDAEVELFVTRSNPLTGSGLKWRWLTEARQRSQGRYLLQWQGPEVLIVDDPINRIEWATSIDSIDIHHDTGRLLEPADRLTLNVVSLDVPQVTVKQFRVNERAVQLRSVRSKVSVHCWVLALFDRHSPNVQQRVCLDQSLAEDVIRLQAEQWTAGLLQSKSTITWSLTESGLQLLARYDVHQWNHVWVSVRYLF
jgi:hypothetical protein